jgi:hypothetical protein
MPLGVALSETAEVVNHFRKELVQVLGPAQANELTRLHGGESPNRTICTSRHDAVVLNMSYIGSDSGAIRTDRHVQQLLQTSTLKPVAQAVGMVTRINALKCTRAHA